MDALGICDEENNVTYVFRTSALEELGLTDSDIVVKSKTELDYILTRRNTGKRITPFHFRD